MARGYTKDDLVGAFLMRFIKAHEVITEQQVENLEAMANSFYDKVGKDTFREYACVTPAVMKEYFEWI